MNRAVKGIARTGAPGAPIASGGAGGAGGAAGAVPLWALPVLVGVLESLAQMYCVAEEERTKRARIEAELSARAERIGLVREAIAARLSASIEERRALFDVLLVRLDAAVASRDVEVVAALLGAIVDLANANPLSELVDRQRVAGALQQEGGREEDLGSG